MKIRIKGNSVRLRLSKPEVANLAINGYIEENTIFVDGVFTYALQSLPDIEKLAIHFKAGKMLVSMPLDFVKDWPENNTVGLAGVMETQDNQHVEILVEKDFKCLDGPADPKNEYYENPNLTC